MKRQLIILALCSLLFSNPARATPPEAITLYDLFIGHSETQVFILRETHDNLGLHIYGIHDVYLVAKSIETGNDEEIWPVYRVYSDSEGMQRTVGLPLEGAVNPFDILAARAARYSNAPVGGYATIDVLSWFQEHQADDDAVMAQIAHSIALTSSAIQPYPTEGYRSFQTPQELMANMQFKAWHCMNYSVRDLDRYPLEASYLVRTWCENEDGDWVSLLVLVPE